MTPLPLIDTHTHFDLADYDDGRLDYVAKSLANGVRHIVLIGLAANHFERMVRVADTLNGLEINGQKIHLHLAMGLHPIYIHEHKEVDLQILADNLQKHKNIAIAEIGLDTYLPALKTPKILARQQHFFIEQIYLAKHYQLPIVLHIRKAHAQVLALLKKHHYPAPHLGGIAHSFSGGEQEAVAFVKMGFKLGVTGQITNPNAKKLRRAIGAAVAYAGVQALVIETDCPDMMPVPCQHLGAFNEPANLPYVLTALSEFLGIDRATLAQQLWYNSENAFNMTFDKF